MSESQRSEIRNPPALDVRIGCPATVDPHRVLPTIDLLSPLTVEGVTFRNRIAVSPMCQYWAKKGVASDWHLVHLGSRAVGGAGLVMVEATAVSPEGRITPGDLGIWDDHHIEPLARIVRFLESQNTVPGIQLAHAGRKGSCAPPFDGGGQLGPGEQGGWPVFAPSPKPFRDTDAPPIDMTHHQIDQVIESFVMATRRALEAGFQIIELHMAHGYLLHSFLSPLSNTRTDHYGGSLENRFRLPLQVVTAVKAKLPSWSPLFVKISATDWVEGGWDLEQSVSFGKALCKSGVKMIDASSGGLVPYAKIPTSRNYQVPFAATIRRESGTGTAAVGLISDPHQANEIITSGSADLVFIGRESLRDPYWPIHAHQVLRGEAHWPTPYGYAVEPKKG